MDAGECSGPVRALLRVRDAGHLHGLRGGPLRRGGHQVRAGLPRGGGPHPAEIRGRGAQHGGVSDRGEGAADRWGLGTRDGPKERIKGSKGPQGPKGSISERSPSDRRSCCGGAIRASLVLG